MFSFGLVAAIAFIVGLFIMDLLYAHRFGWIQKIRKPRSSKGLDILNSTPSPPPSGPPVVFPALSSEEFVENLNKLGCILIPFSTEKTTIEQIPPLDWAELATGDSGWIEIEQAWLRKAQEVFAIFCKKQADYGPTNIGVGGEQGITLRLGDKVSRLFELLGLTSRENAGAPANESIRDTWVDFADYGIIGMIVHDGDWPLVDPNQVWGKAAMIDLMMDMVGTDEELHANLMVRLVELGLAKQIADDLGAEVTNG